MGLIDEHYEKIALGVGGLALIGAVYFGLSKISESETFIAEKNGGTHGNTLADLLKVPSLEALNSISKDNSLEQKKDKDVDRPLFMFQSIPRHARRNKEEILDLFERGSNPVHEDVANSWWFENGIQNHLSFENALELDFDSDGFSNREEHKAGTSPSDATKYPSLLSKVKVERIETRVLEIRFTEAGADSIFFSLTAKNPTVRILSESFKVGEGGPKGNQFNDVGELKDRFLFQELIKGAGIGNDDVIFIDKKGNNRKLKINRRDNPFKLEDYTVFLFLDALGKGNEPAVKLKEGDTFSLPFGGKPQNYKVKSIAKKEEKLYLLELEGPGAEIVAIEVKS
jgi:hypothetical protein